MTDKALKRASDRVSNKAFDPHRIPDALRYKNTLEQRKDSESEEYEE